MVSCLFFVAFGNLNAQSITINEDPIITRMMDMYIENNKATQIFDGFRIQIIATTDRRKMDEVQSNFAARYPDISVDWVQNKPFYKVRAGAYANRTDASNALKKIKIDFPDAYLVPDRIKSSELGMYEGE